MTTFRKPTTRETASAIYNGKPFDFLPMHPTPRVGDRIEYQPMELGKPISHPITRNMYEIVYVDSESPQIQLGNCCVGLRRVR